jgi:hypothetical protein
MVSSTRQSEWRFGIIVRYHSTRIDLIPSSSCLSPQALRVASMRTFHDWFSYTRIVKLVFWPENYMRKVCLSGTWCVLCWKLYRLTVHQVLAWHFFPDSLLLLFCCNKIIRSIRPRPKKNPNQKVHWCCGAKKTNQKVATATPASGWIHRETNVSTCIWQSR